MEALDILKTKVEELIQMHKMALDINQELNNTIKEKEELITNLNTKISLLENKTEENSQKSQLVNDESLRIKSQIDEIIVEIDKCVSDLTRQ